MGQNDNWTIAMIGGGKISGATLFELLDRKRIAGGTVRLFGRSREKLERNVDIASRITPLDQRLFQVELAENLDQALQGADLVLYGATAGLEPAGPYRSFGVMQGAHILHVAERMKELCPEAWLLALTNPPDIPLGAAHIRFGLDKVIGLCNAAVFVRKVLASYLHCAEEELKLYDIGVNHETWFYDIIQGNESIYARLQEELPARYNPDAIDNAFHRSFPEWRLGFVNTVDILRQTGFLSAPVGGSRRFQGLPVTSGEMGKLMKRPNHQDFAGCLTPDMDKERIFSVTRRCAAEFPIYIAEVIESILLNDQAERSIQVLNKGTLPAYPDHAMLHMTCKVGRDRLERPVIDQLPDYIETVLASRIRQNALLSTALANQDEKLLRQSILAYPERAAFSQLEEAIRNGTSVEPLIQLN